MKHKSKKRRRPAPDKRKSWHVNLSLEQLEARHVFSGAPPLVEPHEPPPAPGAAEASLPVTSPNLPLVFAGSDASIRLDDTLNLWGEVISNNNDGLVSSWSVVSGPGAVTFGDAGLPITTAQFSAVGQYVIELTLANAEVSASHAMTVTVDPASHLPAGMVYYRSEETQFSGNGDHVEVAHDADYMLNEGAIAFWFKVSNTSTRQGLFSKDSNGYDTGGHITVTVEANGKLQARLQSTSGSHTVATSSSLEAGVWYHAAVNFGPAGMQLFVDGSLADSDAYGGGLGASSGGAGNMEPIVLGADSGGSGDLVATPVRDPLAGGRLREVVFVDHALSVQEVTALVTADGGSGGEGGGENDEETVTVNLPLAVDEGGVGTITGSLLQTIDANQGPGELTYTVTSAPAHGTLMRSGSATSTFTQADIDAGLITYVHDGGETTSDSFGFSVDDGLGTSSSGTFQIAISSVNNDEQLAINAGLSLESGATASIDATRLSTTDAESGPAQLTYVVTGGAAHGTVRLSGVAASTFTQADINAGRVTYVHDGSGGSSDSFSFTVNDGYGSATTGVFTISVSAVGANTINIDQAWLNARGDGPYYLDQAGKTYVLQTDVTTEGTAFAIIAEDVTFDLNGHTVTYNNAAPIEIPNGSFEQGSGATATGWNFSNAPNAERYQGVWLHNEVYDGDYSLRFNDTTTDQHVTSTSTITLEANTTYSLSAMFEYGGQGTAENPGANGYVRLFSGNLPTREVSWQKTNYRGIKLEEGTFTTGDSDEEYLIQVGIEGHGSSDSPFYIDDIKVQRTNSYGVVISPKSWGPNYLPDLTQYGDARNAVLRNGRIMQGIDAGTRSHGVFIYHADDVTVDNLAITIHGANSSAITGYDMSLKPVTVINNTITSNVQTVSNRDAYDGAVIVNLVGEFGYNTLTNGPHVGIAVSNSHVHHNTISLTTKYTNAFAIIVSDGDGVQSLVHNNTIDSTGDNQSSAGILVKGLGPTKVFDNSVDVKLRANNQEYEGPQISGAYGLQLEKAQNKEIYGNIIKAYSSVADAAALRLTTTEGVAVADNYIHDNIFEAIVLSGDKKAIALSAKNLDESHNNRLENNTIRSDAILVGKTDSVKNLVIEGGVIEFTGSTADFRLAEVLDWNPSVEKRAIEGLRFKDVVFDGAQTRELVSSGDLRQYGTQLPMSYSSALLSWSTTISVVNEVGQKVPNASVSIVDEGGSAVFSGTTDSNGNAVFVLDELRIVGDVKTVLKNYTVTVQVDGSNYADQLVADHAQAITVQVTDPAASSNAVFIPAATLATNGQLTLPGILAEPDDVGNGDMDLEGESPSHDFIEEIVTLPSEVIVDAYFEQVDDENSTLVQREVSYSEGDFDESEMFTLVDGEFLKRRHLDVNI